ncbi:hypothetical protein B0J11DRAFT_551761 [Dendryphion nanum]|uniref:Uncharacterized protein n=1 Tax=Dendryphion nanum TaxID=256645 RepID=A0A9P9DHZ5_9PLEO|nr:hypothetical protein B0J11DRAFT_551761 [Dendryphion nanum]
MESSRARKLPGMPGREPVPKSPAARNNPILWSSLPNIFIGATLLLAVVFAWPRRWIVSGAPLLTYAILLGESYEHRIVPFVPVWTIFSTLNLIYAVASTSWLLYWVFAGFCYPTLLVVCLFQFDATADFARRSLRKTILRDLHFIRDKIAFFDLPALEIDTDVNGLLAIRGVTLSLSTLTLVAHGVEVGIKLSDDIELAIQTDKVTVSLFRDIEIDDVYANVKGGELEMTFGHIVPNAYSDDDELMVSDTPILRAASVALEGTLASSASMVKEMTDSNPPKDSADTQSAFETVTKLSPDEEKAGAKYDEMLRNIAETSSIAMAKQSLRDASRKSEISSSLDQDNIDDLRAAICGAIHDNPSIPHPPSKSIRVSTLRKTSHPQVKKFLHRLPLLYRLLLSPLCYFHPVKIKSVTAASSGKWFVSLVRQYLFKQYTEQDTEIRKLEARISAWLADANFAVELGSIHSTAQFPINTNYDIECHFKIGDVMAYRTLRDGVDLKRVVQLGGADAVLSIPTYMFPHHEHIMPAEPTEYEEMEMEQVINDLEGTPKEVQARTALEQLRKDEANMHISAHAHLPAQFHQDLLNFTAAIVKATKVIETDKSFEDAKTLRELKRVSTNASDSDVSSVASTTSTVTNEDNGFKNFMRKVDTGFKDASIKTRDGMRKAGANTVSAMANDRWIAKLVGKVTKKLERAQGDVGYSGNVPISLEKHRRKAESESKLLP